MQSNQTHQIPHNVVVSSRDSMHYPPKEYRSEASYFEDILPAVMDIPTPYNLNGDKKKRASLRPNPHRKYSKQWFGYAYDNAVRGGKWPRIIYAAVGLILVGTWIGIMLAFAYEEVNFEVKNANSDLSRGATTRVPYDLYMKGTLRKFDPLERTLTVAWSLSYVSDVDNKTLLDLGTNENNTLHINIYRDVVAVPEDRNITKSELNTLGIDDADYVYRIDNITAVPIAVLGAHSWDDVTLEIDFVQAIPDWAWTQPLFGYPYVDQWDGSIVFAATDRDAATLTGLNNSFVVPIANAVLVDSTYNWHIKATKVNNTCLPANAPDGCELHIDFTGRRPGLVIFAAMVALVVNWTTTIGIFLITCESLVMQRTYILAETDILGVCLTALFALPSVRAILPGAPDFGAVIDLIGIIPNIIIISLCTTAISISKLRIRRPKEDKGE